MSKEWRLGCEYCNQKQARVKALEEALRPFAREYIWWESEADDKPMIGDNKITVADLRRAAETLKG